MNVSVADGDYTDVAMAERGTIRQKTWQEYFLMKE